MENNQSNKRIWITEKKAIFLTEFLPWIPKIKELNWEEQRELEVDIKYEGYIRRQFEEVKELSSYEVK